MCSHGNHPGVRGYEIPGDRWGGRRIKRIGVAATIYCCAFRGHVAQAVDAPGNNFETAAIRLVRSHNPSGIQVRDRTEASDGRRDCASKTTSHRAQTRAQTTA
jgi:hypothetical protein